jgi:alkanesulfonate monooxygenase SsuD/methylene tetrahydromethanopterin reductase-like flavin-dependent oxidoreductase (luciferase family)
MHFGIFVEERRRGTSEAVAFQDAVELTEAAEAGGLDGVWLGEIHFTPVRSVQSAPMALVSFLAARTARVRIGMAVTVLPLVHPLRIAEEVATVDHLSRGRFDLGIGRSGAASTYDALGIPYGESQARFEEALAILREAWKGEPFSYQGRFHRITNTVVTPRPYQLPHPPLRMAANSPETFPWVGRAGLPLFVGVRDLDIPELRVHLESYRAAWRQAGHAGSGDVYLRLPVYAAPTEEAALEEPRENILYFFQRHTELARARLGRAGAGPTERIRARVADLAALSYDRILETRVAFGTAASLIRRLGAVRDDLGLDGIIAELNPGGLLPMEQQRRTLEILAHEVIPAIR